MKIETAKVVEEIDKRLEYAKDGKTMFSAGYVTALLHIKEAVNMLDQIAEVDERLQEIEGKE